MRVLTVKDHYDGNKVSNVCAVGLLFAANVPPDLLRLIARAGAEKVRDWAGNGVRVKNVRQLCSQSGFAVESRFDASHGRRYACAVYPTGNATARRVALAACHGMKNTNPELTT